MPLLQRSFRPAAGTPHRQLVKAQACPGHETIKTLALWQAYPLDLVRTRLAAQTTSSYYHGIGGTLRTIVRDEGLAGLYRGVGPTLLQTVRTLLLSCPHLWRPAADLHLHCAASTAPPLSSPHVSGPAAVCHLRCILLSLSGWDR